tara:strand:- start:3236 stop:3766 length:531 start_codon:yes stop_codon:yes gene_type:complete
VFTLLLVDENGVTVNTELFRLCKLLEIIDSKLYEIEACISRSVDPESDGLFDLGEYFIGVGFVAIQQHLNDSLIGIDLNKKEAYSLGPIHSSGVSSISVINAAANWWKHEAEWFKNDNIPKNGKHTVEIIRGISNGHEYALSNVLASFSESKCLSLTKSVVPHIEEWEKALGVEIR